MLYADATFFCLKLLLTNDCLSLMHIFSQLTWLVFIKFKWLD